MIRRITLDRSFQDIKPFFSFHTFFQSTFPKSFPWNRLHLIFYNFQIIHFLFHSSLYAVVKRSDIFVKRSAFYGFGRPVSEKPSKCHPLHLANKIDRRFFLGEKFIIMGLRNVSHRKCTSKGVQVPMRLAECFEILPNCLLSVFRLLLLFLLRNFERRNNSFFYLLKKE